MGWYLVMGPSGLPYKKGLYRSSQNFLGISSYPHLVLDTANVLSCPTRSGLTESGESCSVLRVILQETTTKLAQRKETWFVKLIREQLYQ